MIAGEADKELAILRRESQSHFEDSIEKVHQLNAILTHLLDYLEGTKLAIEWRLDWVGTQLGATGIVITLCFTSQSNAILTHLLDL